MQQLVPDGRDHCPECSTKLLEYCITSPSITSSPEDPVRQIFVAFQYGSGVIEESFNGFPTDSLSLPNESVKDDPSNKKAVACLKGLLGNMRGQGWEIDEANVGGLWFRYRLRRRIKY